MSSYFHLRGGNRDFESSTQKVLPKKLGFIRSTTIIRSKEQLQQLVNKNPFKGMEHSQKSSLNVTFLKNERSSLANKTNGDLKFPYKVDNRDYILLGMYDGAICSVIDLTSAKTPDLMLWLEKQLGKEITTRTWKTVEKILKVMG